MNSEKYFEAISKLSEEDYCICAEAYTELETEHERCVKTIQELSKKYKKVHDELCKECQRYRRDGLNACMICDYYDK